MISFSWSGEKYLRPASIETIFFLASFSFTWAARSVATAGASTLATSLFSSFSFSDSVFLASSVISALAGVSSAVTGSATAGAGATSTFGASVVVTGAAGVVFSVVGAVSSFSSLVGGVTSPVVWIAGWFSVGAGTTPSAATACAWKAKPINTEAAPIAYLRIEKRCLFSGLIKKPPLLYFW